MKNNYFTIETTEFFTGNVEDYYLKKIIRRNKFPQFKREDKYFDFVKLLKSTTSVIPWLIKIDGSYYVALFSFMRKIDYCISFYNATKNGQYDIYDPICIYRSYVDLETACDRFCVEYIAMQINQSNEKIINILNEEL